MSVDATGGDSAVLDNVFSSSRDRKADSAAFEPQDKASPPEPKVEPAPEPEAKADTEQPEAEAPQSRDPLQKYRDPDTGRLVPLNELKSERAKRQEEARLRQEAEKRYEETQRQIDALRRQMEASQRQPPQPQQPPPDWLTDPEAAARHQQQQIEHRLFEQRVYLSEKIAKQAYKDYDVAKEAFHRAAQNNVALQRAISDHPDPADYAYQVGKRLLMMQEIGDDPSAYRAKIEQEAREKVLAELKAGKPSNGMPPPQRFPGTLADATSAGDGNGAILTDQAMMADVFSTSRKRR